MASKTSCIPKPRSTGSTTVEVGQDPEFEAITYSQVSSHLRVVEGSSFTVTTDRELPGTGFRANAKSTRWQVHKTESSGGEFAEVYSYDYVKPAVFELSPCDVRRWKLAREALDKYRLEKPDYNLDLVTVKSVPESNGWTGPSEPSTSSIWSLFGFTLVAAGYGALHVLGWNARFPNHRELKLWRISTIIITSPAAVCFLVICLVQLFTYTLLLLTMCARKLQSRVGTTPKQMPLPKQPAIKEKLPPKKKRSLGIIFGFCFAAPILVIGKAIKFAAAALGPSAIIVLYFPARGYLVYESFRTVFYLPKDAYKATNWTQYIPHIT